MISEALPYGLESLKKSPTSPPGTESLVDLVNRYECQEITPCYCQQHWAQVYIENN